MKLKDWKYYKEAYFRNESELVLWGIFDEVLGKKIPTFRDLLERIIDGFGYSVCENYGYAMYNDNDELKDLQYVLVYFGDRSYRLNIHRFIELLKVACDYYITKNPEGSNYIEAAFHKISQTYNAEESGDA